MTTWAGCQRTRGLRRQDRSAGESQGGVGDLAGTLYSLQDFLLGTAARLEGTQQRVASAKEAVLCKRREVRARIMQPRSSLG